MPFSIDGKMNTMRQTQQFSALNRKSSYDVAYKNDRRMHFNAPRQSYQVGNRTQDMLVATANNEDKYKSVNQIRMEQQSTRVTGRNLANGQSADFDYNRLTFGNMDKYNQSSRVPNAADVSSGSGRPGQDKAKVWINYKNLMFKSMVVESDEDSSSGDKSKGSQEQSRGSNEEGENLADEEANENFEECLPRQDQPEGAARQRHSAVAGGLYIQFD